MKRLYPIILIVLLAACGGSQATEPPPPTTPPEWLTKPPTPAITSEFVDQLAANADVEPEATTFIAPTSTVEVPMPESTESPTSTPIFHLPRLFGRQWSMSAAPGVPEEIIAGARSLAGERPDDFLWVEPGSLPTDITLKSGQGEPLAERLYVVAAPFAAIEDDISEAGLIVLWSAAETAERQLFLEEDVARLFTELWGPAGANVQIVGSGQITEKLWAQRPALTIIPFEQLTPDLKVLRLNGDSPLAAEYDPETYPLLRKIGVEGEQEALAAFLGAWSGTDTNFNRDKLTRVALTGVTALVRATATQMEIDGILSPARDVGPVLRAADVAHISNEVSFDAACPEPNPVGGTSFCSQDEYFALLEEIGTDVVELTGNHLNDWGTDNVLRTIDMYEAAGMDYFGGGRNATDAARPAIIEHNGNRIALVGCNSFGPTYAWATTSSAGARACGPEFYEEIKQLKEDGYVVIATQQYTEYYQYSPMPDQERDFRAIADAGAAAVSGSQGHHAQGFDFHNGAFIHYGLGNLFFDQMYMDGTRQTFVDTYSIYDGHLINVDLWTGLIENYSMPRKMTEGERREVLQTVFQASGW